MGEEGEEAVVGPPLRLQLWWVQMEQVEVGSPWRGAVQMEAGEGPGSGRREEMAAVGS